MKYVTPQNMETHEWFLAAKQTLGRIALQKALRKSTSQVNDYCQGRSGDEVNANPLDWLGEICAELADVGAGEIAAAGARTLLRQVPGYAVVRLDLEPEDGRCSGDYYKDMAGALAMIVSLGRNGLHPDGMDAAVEELVVTGRRLAMAYRREFHAGDVRFQAGDFEDSEALELLGRARRPRTLGQRLREFFGGWQ